MSYCETNPQTGGTTYEMYEALKEISERGQLLVEITEDNRTSLLPGIFEFVTDTAPDGSKYSNYRIKVNPSLLVQPTGPNGEIYWKETVTLEPQTTIATTGNDLNTIAVDNVKALLGIKAGSTLIIEQPVGNRTVEVVSVSGNNITLRAGTNIDVVAGQHVYRGAYGVAPDCNVKADNGYTLPTFAQKFTYSRRLYVTYQFLIKDFNIDRASYNYGRTAQDHLSALMQAGNAGATREFISTLWFDQGVKPGDTLLSGQTATYFQTMGIIPHIQKSQTSTGKRLIKQYANCTPAEGSGLTKNQAMIQDFMNEAQNAISSGLYTDKKITVFCNEVQANALIYLNKYFSEFQGIQIWENGVQTLHEFSSFTIKYGVHTIDFVYEQALNKVSRKDAFYVMMPMNQLHFVQKPFHSIELNGQSASLSGPNAMLSNGMPVLKFVDRTKEETNGEGDCYIFRSFMDYALIVGGVDSGAYRIGIGFKPTTMECNVCEDTTTTTVIG